MQNRSTEPSNSNVVSLFDRAREIKNRKEEIVVEEDVESIDSFSEVMRRNAENKARMAKERSKANQGVIRSHRLKR